MDFTETIVVYDINLVGAINIRVHEALRISKIKVIH